MGLKHIKLEEAVVENPGGDFAVRGLSLNDIAFLIQRHGARLQALFTDLIAKSNQAGGELTVEGVAGFALPLIQAAPEIASELIACAASKPWEKVDQEDLNVAYGLITPVQVDALEKALTLTFAASGGPKKLLETVVRLAQGTTGLLESLRT